MNMQTQWNLLLGQLMQSVSNEYFEALVKHMRPLQLVKNMLIIGVPTQQFTQLVQQNIGDALRAAVAQVYGPQIQASFKVIPKADPNANAGHASRSGSFQNTAAYSPQNARPRAEFDSRLQANYTFERFGEGESNRAPLAMARSFVENPAQQTFNPFFLFGPSGVGKTHLVTAVGHAIKERYPQMRVLFVTSREFQAQYQNAVVEKKINDFIHFYQTIDLLILDDFQEIKTPGTQNTFFHIFNHLQANQRKILITCDRPPAELEGIEDRLLTRLKWGMTNDIRRPDLQLRRDIIRAEANRSRLELPADVFEYIAENISDNVREIQGALRSLLAKSFYRGGIIDLETTRIVVAQLVNQAHKELTFESIIAQVSAFCKVKQSDIHSKSRKKEFVAARHMTMYLMQKYTKASQSQIGRHLGGRDHTTVLHACTKFEKRLAVDHEFRASIEAFEATLKK